MSRLVSVNRHSVLARHARCRRQHTSRAGLAFSLSATLTALLSRALRRAFEERSSYPPTALPISSRQPTTQPSINHRFHNPPPTKPTNTSHHVPRTIPTPRNRLANRLRRHHRRIQHRLPSVRQRFRRHTAPGALPVRRLRQQGHAEARRPNSLQGVRIPCAVQGEDEQVSFSFFFSRGALGERDGQGRGCVKTETEMEGRRGERVGGMFMTDFLARRMIQFEAR